MKLVLNVETLRPVLALASAATASRTPKAALQCLLVDAGDTVSVSASDGSHALRQSLHQVEVTEPGRCLIPAEQLAQVVQYTKSPTVTIHAGDKGVKVLCEAKSNLLAPPVGDWHDPAWLSGDPILTMPCGELIDMIGQVKFAAPRGEHAEQNYVMNCLVLGAEGKKVYAVATDGRVLACRYGRGKWGQERADQLLMLPVKALKFVVGLPSDTELKVYAGDGRVRFETEDACFETPQVEGIYPRFRDFLPKSSKMAAEIECRELLDALRMVSVTTADDSKAVKFDFQPDGLALSSRSSSFGGTEIKVPLASFDGEPMLTAYDPSYVADMARHCGSNQLQLSIFAPKSAGVCRVGTDFLGMVIPIAL